MGEQRQRYNDEFKQQTVKFIQEQTKSMSEIAEELNIPVGTLHQWLAKYRQFESESIASPERLRQLDFSADPSRASVLNKLVKRAYSNAPEQISAETALTARTPRAEARYRV